MDNDRNESFVVRDQSTSEILALIDEGKKPVCPVCRAPVLVAATPARARELGIPPGMQCSMSERHIISEFLFGDRLPKVDKGVHERRNKADAQREQAQSSPFKDQFNR
jgi:hypothetical protein